jgi:dipeptidyl aminopeptidase/acylaminoacyl peptidase
MSSPQAPPATDIYELAHDGTLSGLNAAKLLPVSTAPGYDNQPSYTADGNAILFTANRDGKQMDIYELNRASRRVTQLVSTPEGEYSPTPTPDGKGFSVIRVEADSTQRLWRFDRDGTNPRLILTDIKPVGYHAWIDADQLALFVLGQPATLQHARVSTGKATVIAQNIGRSLQLIPKTRAVSFVSRESSDNLWIKQFDTVTGAVSSIARPVAGADEPYIAWLPDGTMVMAAATKLFALRRGGTGWQEIYDVAGQKLGNVTRLAVAPDGRALALVVSELATKN